MSWMNTTPDFSCTYGRSSYGGTNAQYGVGGCLSAAFTEINKANVNWTMARDTAMATGNHFDLPFGTHRVGETLQIINDAHTLRYKNMETGYVTGCTKDGIPFSYQGI